MKKILLIDGNLLLFRSFYAGQTISKELSNIGVHLFFNSFFEIFKSEDPTYVFFAFDAFGPTKRHEEFEQYKAGRIKAPKELYDQKEIICEILSTMKFKHFSKIGDEADDLIASISHKYKDNNKISIFSEDKDLLQLIDDNVDVIVKNKNKNINSKYIKINNENFYGMFNFFPYQIIDFKGIAGDNSDNLPGIKGIGSKQAINLLNKYKTLEGIYENIDQLTKKQKELFLANKSESMLCKKLATLNKFVEIDFDLDEMLVSLDNLKNDNVYNVLNKYQLKRILNIINNLK
ncbi:MAG: 5'-3' exonuclease [Mycoplasma sp.]|nr:5'-3' exonuclease [Mycoplasma sp.]